MDLQGTALQLSTHNMTSTPYPPATMVDPVS